MVSEDGPVGVICAGELDLADRLGGDVVGDGDEGIGMDGDRGEGAGLSINTRSGTAYKVGFIERLDVEGLVVG